MRTTQNIFALNFAMRAKCGYTRRGATQTEAAVHRITSSFQGLERSERSSGFEGEDWTARSKLARSIQGAYGALCPLILPAQQAHKIRKLS